MWFRRQERKRAVKQLIQELQLRHLGVAKVQGFYLREFSKSQLVELANAALCKLMEKN